MKTCLSLIILLYGTLAVAFSPDTSLRDGYDNPPSLQAPPRPAAFTRSCEAWRLEYLVQDGELSLWTSCRASQGGLPTGTELHVLSRLPLDVSYVANAYAIHAASPSDSAPVSFSSLCHACRLSHNASSSVMTCNCTTTTNGDDGGPVDLGLGIAGMPDGVPCFNDGVVCAVRQSAYIKTPDATTLATSANFSFSHYNNSQASLHSC